LITAKLISNTKKYFSTSINLMDLVLNENNGFDKKKNSMKLIFYPSLHDLTRIDLMDIILTKNDGFEPKRPKTLFYPG
jgi:hypothetical protein